MDLTERSGSASRLPLVAVTLHFAFRPLPLPVAIRQQGSED